MRSNSNPKINWYFPVQKSSCRFYVPILGQRSSPPRYISLELGHHPSWWPRHRDSHEKHGNVWPFPFRGLNDWQPFEKWWPFEVWGLWGNEALNRPLNSWQLTRVSQLGWKQNRLDLIQPWSHGGLLQSFSLDQEVALILSSATCCYLIQTFLLHPISLTHRLLVHLANVVHRPTPQSDGPWAMREPRNRGDIFSRLIPAERNSILVNPINCFLPWQRHTLPMVKFGEMRPDEGNICNEVFTRGLGQNWGTNEAAKLVHKSGWNHPLFRTSLQWLRNWEALHCVMLWVPAPLCQCFIHEETPTVGTLPIRQC